jgi:hypothetical protein
MARLGGAVNTAALLISEEPPHPGEMQQRIGMRETGA